MAKSLAHTQDREEIARRLATLTSEAVRQWGTMTVGGMLCHVDDSYKVVMGERPLFTAKMNVPKGLAKFVALRTPMRWPRNLPTGENLRQGGGGTPPAEFAQDQARALATFGRFCSCTTLIAQHPFFGGMTAAEWMRWGYLHADHHLRQFSA